MEQRLKTNEQTNASTYDRTNLNLSVIKSFLNERLTFTVGSALDFGLTTQQATYAAVQFLPTVTAEWKLTENGRVVLTFFSPGFLQLPLTGTTRTEPSNRE